MCGDLCPGDENCNDRTVSALSSAPDNVVRSIAAAAAERWKSALDLLGNGDHLADLGGVD